jgi:hypothetical protein
MADEKPANRKPLGSSLTAISLILFTALMVVASWFIRKPGWNYIAVMVLMLLFMATLGLKISGRPAGILINERNLISLSRFQMVLWTVLILAAFLIAAIGRIRAGSIADALAIGLDEKLWGLLGISTASLIGTPLIQSTKKTKPLTDDAATKAAEALVQKGEGGDKEKSKEESKGKSKEEIKGEIKEEIKEEIKDNAQGTLYANAKIEDAAFSDMFEGDEVGNTAYVDLAKVQMFFFTIVAALSYGVSLFQWIATEQFLHPVAPLTQVFFPALSGGLVAVLGISHAGFLVNKSTDHTPTGKP